MLIVDYNSKSYHRFLNDMPQVNRHNSRFLITINGASQNELTAITNDLTAHIETTIQHTTAVIDKLNEESVESLFSEARNSKTPLLFEQADLLFDKKTALKNSHERDHGFNLNHFFKSIAKHRGIVLLSTKNKQTLNASMSTKMDVLIRFK